jgi:hypothetical protein
MYYHLIKDDASILQEIANDNPPEISTETSSDLTSSNNSNLENTDSTSTNGDNTSPSDSTEASTSSPPTTDSSITTASELPVIDSTLELPSVIDTEEINTLVELPVELGTTLSYYYPYFYKAHLVTFTEDNYDTSYITKTCNMENCDKCDKVKCFKCEPGYFLHKDRCISACPDKFNADILRQKCMHKDSPDVVYNVAYSIGSCKNMCGKIVKDCSCEETCKQNGNCCTDYDNMKCEYIFDMALEVKDKVENCEYAENIENGVKCNQCDIESYFYKNKCLDRCPKDYIINKINRYCKKPQGIKY